MILLSQKAITPCIDCDSIKRILIIKLIPTSRQDFTYPKFIPQIKECCDGCKRYIRFAPQTPELIAQLNQKLEEVVING